jgi:hypothetical protein
MAGWRVFWAVAAGGWNWLLGMPAHRRTEQKRQKAKHRREAVQRFFHHCLFGRFNP